MPIIKSAKKKLKQDKSRTELNDNVRHVFKDALRDVRRKSTQHKAVKNDDVAKVFSALDVASKRNVIHPNKAARLKSRISKLQAPVK